MAILYIKKGMVEALRYIMPDGVVEDIDAFIPRRPEIEWEAVYGSTTIYATQRFITHGGGPGGGYVYFYRERPAGWYRWERSWGAPPNLHEARRTADSEV